jgi:hypothetical protein
MKWSEFYKKVQFIAGKNNDIIEKSIPGLSIVINLVNEETGHLKYKSNGFNFLTKNGPILTIRMA